MGYTMSNDPGLAAARPSQEQQGTLDMPYRGLLLRI
jgi:hypothetical protein